MKTSGFYMHEHTYSHAKMGDSVICMVLAMGRSFFARLPGANPEPKFRLAKGFCG